MENSCFKTLKRLFYKTFFISYTKKKKDKKTQKSREQILGCRRQGRVFHGGLAGKEPACQSRRCGFDPWIGKIPSLYYPCLKIPWMEELGELQSKGS